MNIPRTALVSFGIALLVGAGAGFGARRLQPKPAVVPAVKPAAHDSAHAATDTTAVRVIDEKSVVGPESAPQHADAPRADTQHVATAPAVPATTDSLVAANHARLGRLFAGMAPKEAARVLEQMTDADVTSVLRSLRDRQASVILAQLQPKRAATISRSLLQSQAGKS